MTSPTEGMKGGGYYDAHSEYQRRVAASGRDRLSALLEELTALGADPCTIVDYGCSEGANSIGVIGDALRVIRKRHPDSYVVAIHNDLPSNDFNALFQNLERRADSYLHVPGGPVRAMASGSSFYDPVVPPASAQLGVSFSAIHWLREPPCAPVPDSFLIDDAPEPARSQLAGQADDDWSRFLAARASDLGRGGLLFVQMIGTATDRGREVTASQLLHAMQDVADAMVGAGELRAEAVRAYVFPTYMRTVEEALAPLGRSETSLGRDFEVQLARVDRVENPYAEAYRRSGDAAAYADRYVGFVRAFSESTIRRGLIEPGVVGGSVDAALDAFYGELASRTASDPDWSMFEDWTLTVGLTRT